MHIPDRIQLGGFDIDIVHMQNMAREKNQIGQSSYTTQEILLDKDAAPAQFVEQAYLHELVHWIFYSMSEYDSMNDEKKVDLFATFLHQALTSNETEEERAALEENKRLRQEVKELQDIISNVERWIANETTAHRN